MKNPISALLPRGVGHQFAIYGDSCSGVPAGLHEGTLAGVNAVVRRLSPDPEFIIFPGDEVLGLTSNPESLRAQWRHWLDVEMAWLDREKTAIYHCAGNHTTYDTMSESIFREVLAFLPRNGPADQQGLSYLVRRNDLLLVFINTCWSGLGGEGHVETNWVEKVLQNHNDARYKLVVGHHPIFPVNGYSGPREHFVAPADGSRLWSIFREHGVLAYVASHILAFDIQVHDGILQLTSAGAGTKHRMPEGIEYLHCVQAAIDAEGIRYQVLDTEGQVREHLTWPVQIPPQTRWEEIAGGPSQRRDGWQKGRPLLLRFKGAFGANVSTEQTLFCDAPGDDGLAFWIGLRGASQVVSVKIPQAKGRSPGYWQAEAIGAGTSFDFQIMVHPDMGPGGILYRRSGGERWTSMTTSAAWGAERVDIADQIIVGHSVHGPDDRLFLGSDLRVSVLAI